MASAKTLLAQIADLPPICVCCGEPATRVRRQEFPLSRALSAAILVTSAILNALVWTKRTITLTLPVCEYHRRRGRQSNQTFFRGMVLTAVIGVAAYLASQFDDAVGNYLGVAVMIVFIVTIVVGMHEVDDGLKVKSLSSDSLMLTGVNRKFAEAVEMLVGCPPGGGPNRAAAGAASRSGSHRSA
jgi:hypothetical protein